MPRAPKSCANPLFHAWVQSFHDEKDFKPRGGQPRATGYENGLHSLATCTTKYAHPKELLVLDGVGPTCVRRLTEKLEDHCARKGLPMPEFKKKERGAVSFSFFSGAGASVSLSPVDFAAKKAPAVAKKPVRRANKEAEEDEESGADFSSSSSTGKVKRKAKGGSDDEEAEYEVKENVASAPARRRGPARAASKKTAVLVAESSDEEE
ncbi:hypothetical protein C8R46DRAFT_892202 [Mycena filopes]|nr:hypothetical protein C8R46DRAFT_892202 [Mycena filopes]